MDDIEMFVEDFFFFLEAGFIAVNQSDENSTRKLFAAAELLDPENSLSKVGLGYMHLHKLEIKKACACFEEVLAKDPTNEMAKTFLGLCLTMSCDEVARGEKLLTQTSSSSDKLIKNLSHSALDFVDEFVKKDPSPVELTKNNSRKKK